MTPREIEALIGAHPDVLQVVVVPTIGRSGEQTLVAHYVLRPGASLSAVELRECLDPALLIHPVPLVLRRHAVLPPTRNGRLDLREEVA